MNPLMWGSIPVLGVMLSLLSYFLRVFFLRVLRYSLLISSVTKTSKFQLDSECKGVVLETKSIYLFQGY